MNEVIGPGGLVASLVLVVVAVALSAVRHLGLGGPIVWAAARAAVQLALVGVALGLVLQPGRPLALSWAWVAVMVVFAAFTTARRAPDVPGAFSLALAAYTAAVAVSLSVLFGLRIFPLDARSLVPLSGLVVGNSLTATVLVGRRIVRELDEHADAVEARLALGLSPGAAADPHVREALRTALIPQIESTKAVGIVFLPGAMVGLVLGGVAPAEAVKVQAAVMYLVLGSVSTTTAVIALGLTRRMFTPDERLRRPSASRGGH